MSVTYYYETANGLTAGATTTTSGSVVETNELLVVTSGSSITAPQLLVSAVDLTGSGTAVAQPSDAVYDGGSITVSGNIETLSGGAALVTSGGIIISAVVNQGGGIVIDGGTTSGSIVSGGFEDIYSGGLASGSTISGGGSQTIYSGGTVSAASIYAGSTQEIHSGGVAIGNAIEGLGIQDVQAGATASATSILAGATQTVHAGGQALSNAVTGTVNNYGYDAGATVSSGGVDNVMSGGYTVTTILVSGGTQVVQAGGNTASVIVQALGVQTVAAGGKALNTELFGGTINVQSGGILTGLTTSTDPGLLIVSGGGVAKGSIFNGGEAEVLTGGVISGTVMINAQELLQGGTAIGSDIRAGAGEVIMSGGLGNGTTLEAGGSVVVYAGGTIKNLHVNGAGTVALDANAIVSGDIVLSGSGSTIQLLGAPPSSLKLDGLAAGDKIDLFSITGGVAANYNPTADTLTVTDKNGAVLTTISLGTIPSGVFSVSQDSGGGTLITVDANVQTAAAAVAGFQAGSLYTQVTVTDSAADVTANLSGLESIAAAGKLAAITLTDSGYASIAVTAAQLSADAAAVNAISGNFILTVDATTASNATIAGLSNHATVVDFAGTASQYTVTAAGDGVTVTVSGTAIGTDHISNAEILKFSDFSEVLASNTPVSGATLSAANIAELYAAGLGRAPDAAGLSYYENALKATPGLTGATVASWFLASPEYTAAHTYAQTSAGDGQFVSDLYTNMLHRSGTTAEITYYQNIINQFTAGQTAGTAAYTAAELAGHSVVLADFSASGEFLANIQITAQHPASAQHWLVLI